MFVWKMLKIKSNAAFLLYSLDSVNQTFRKVVEIAGFFFPGTDAFFISLSKLLKDAALVEPSHENGNLATERKAK